MLIEGDYGIALKWNFVFDIEYWKRKENGLRRRISLESVDSFEEKLLVQIINLRKSYSSTTRDVLKNISFNLYENEINVVVGHNGAGLSL